MTILRLPDRAHRSRVPATDAYPMPRTAEILILPCIRRERLDSDQSRAADAAQNTSICA